MLRRLGKSWIVMTVMALVTMGALPAFGYFGDAEPVDEPPAVEVPAEEVPAEEVPAEEVPAEEVPAEEVPAEEVPVEEVPAEEVPVEEGVEDEAGPVDEGGDWFSVTDNVISYTLDDGTSGEVTVEGDKMNHGKVVSAMAHELKGQQPMGQLLRDVAQSSAGKDAPGEARSKKNK